MNISRTLPLALCLLSPLPAVALTADEMDAARYDGTPLPEGQSALTARVQVLLDRAGVSVAVVDGYAGGMTETGIRAFEKMRGFPEDGMMDEDVWYALDGDVGTVTQSYTITEADTQGIVPNLPSDYGEMAQIERMAYTSVAEKLAEDFHMDEEFLEQLNPGIGWTAGETIRVVDPGANVTGKVTRITIDANTQRLQAYDAEGNELANYPVAVGSESTPSPSGEMGVLAVAVEPTYHYNPDVNFKQGDNDEPLTIPPGPNGPVGIVWIDLEKDTYGIHGTPEPASLFSAYSHGCVRMTNWDVMELAEMTDEGTRVEFIR